MMYNQKKIHTPLILTILAISIIFIAYSRPYAQENKEAGAPAEESENLQEYMEAGMKEIDLYSLEELLDTTIVSASKSEESSFDAPLSSTVITKTEIEKTGATSIAETLRLVPGILVFEQTNGNYDVHIRGFNHIPPNTDMIEATNTISLVMIDGRPVFNYFSGGTIWETFPIDLNDIERIEIVRGASSALYGPNAGSGVINIITKRNPNEGFHSSANIYGGNHNTYIGNASAGYAFKDLSIIVSGNYQKRDRYNVSYYSFGNDKYVSNPADIVMTPGYPRLYNINNDHDIDDIYPDPELSLEKKAGNIFITYKPDKDIKLDLSGGYQSSIAQASLIENGGCPLSFRKSDTGFAHLIAEMFGFTGQVSYYGGTLDTLLGSEDVINDEDGDVWKHDTNVIEGLLEYNYKLGTLVLRPGVSYRKVVYDGDYIGGEQELTDGAAFIRAEYTMFDAWRLIAAIRGDKYNHPDDPYLSYQFITTYKENKNNITRASYSRAHREAFMNRTYLDFAVFTGRTLHLNGNKDLDLLTIDVYEIGHKLRLFENAEIDLEVFYSAAKDLTIMETTYVDSSRRDMKYFNADTEAEQIGSTLSCGLILKEVQLKIFGTLQRTRVKDYLDETGTLTDTDNYSGTPDFYGGFYINYQPIAKLNLNLNGYYASKYTFDYRNTESGLDGNIDIKDVIVLSAKAMYYVWHKSSVFVNVRNVLGREEREFVGGDRIEMLALGGATLEI